MTRRHLLLLLFCAACAPAVEDEPPIDADDAPDATDTQPVPPGDQGVVDDFGGRVTDGAGNRVVP